MSAPSNEYLAVVKSTFVPSGVFSGVFSLENLSIPGLEVWTAPCISLVVSALPLTPYTVGVYVVDASTVTGLPSSPGIVTLAATVNGLAVPMYP